MSAEGPWAPEDVLPLVDFDGDAPWHGAPEPPPIEADANPGALVAVLYGPDGIERARWLITQTDPAAGVDEASEACAADPATSLVMHDGDTGRAVVSMRVGPQKK